MTFLGSPYKILLPKVFIKEARIKSRACLKIPKVKKEKSMVKKVVSALACLALIVSGGVAMSACGKSATVVESEQELVEAVQKGGDIRLGKDIVLSQGLTIANDVSIDLNNKKLGESIAYSDNNANDKSTMFYITGGGSLTVTGSGKVESDDLYVFWVNGSADKEANLVIENGSYKADCSVVYVTYGKAEVKGGTFKIENELHPEYIKYMLNMKDGNGIAGTASIVVTGGSFTGYDPANSLSETPAKNFVKEGYKSTVKDGVYTVTKA